MREIKFRAWDKELKEMFTDTPFLMRNGGSGEEFSVLWEDPEGRANKCEGIVIMQYTGLKDKNGKDIYEGDVAEHPKGSGVVTYSEGRYDVTDFYYPQFDEPSDAFGEGIFLLEVIGNIYENPELICRN